MKLFATFGLLAFISLLVCIGTGTSRQSASVMTGGSPDAGRREMEFYGCASCHLVPGVAGANGMIGPSLKHLANRVYIAGVLKNTPDNLIHWIQNAPSVDPKTAMPNLQIPEPQARDIASYLYKLE